MSDLKDFVIEKGVLKKYTGNDKHITVPENVKTISSYAFNNSHELLTVTISNGTKKIDSYAFKDCTGLKKVILPETIEVIGDESFRNCTNLKEFICNGIPNKVGNLAFWGCWALYESSESQPDFLKNFWARIGSGALTKDEAKKLYVLSKSKGTITIKDFYNVSFRKAMDSVYEYYFNNKEERLFIPCSIDGIPVVKAPCKNIPQNAVVYCTQEYFDKLSRSAKVSTTLRWLSEDRLIKELLTDKILAFINKYPNDIVCALEEIEKVETIKNFFSFVKAKPEFIDKLIKAHYENAEITAMLLSLKNSSEIPNEDFSLDSVKKMTVSELKKIWTYETVTYAETGKKEICITNYKSKEKQVVVPGYIGKIPVGKIKCIFPDYVESIEFPNSDMEIMCSFQNCIKMADVDGFICVNVGNRRIVTDYIGDKDIDVLNIPEGITENVYGSFKELNMREVKVPEGFAKLAARSFSDCKNLQKIVLPESLQSIGYSAFYGASALRHLYIPSGVTDIGFCVFSDKTVTIYGEAGSAAYDYAEKYKLTFSEGIPS